MYFEKRNLNEVLLYSIIQLLPQLQIGTLKKVILLYNADP